MAAIRSILELMTSPFGSDTLKYCCGCSRIYAIRTKMGRYGILIFPCLLFVLFEKITESWWKWKTWYFPPRHQILKSWLKPVCFLTSNYGRFWICLPSLYRQIWLFDFCFLSLAQSLHQLLSYYLSYNHYKPLWLAQEHDQYSTFFSDLAQSYYPDLI